MRADFFKEKCVFFHTFSAGHKFVLIWLKNDIAVKYKKNNRKKYDTSFDIPTLEHDYRV